MSGKTSDLYVVRMLGPPETWMVPEAAVSNPPRSSRRCSSPSTVDSAARRACYEQPGPALAGGRAAVRVRGPNLGEYADSLVAKAQVRATLVTISDDAYNEYLGATSTGDPDAPRNCTTPPLNGMMTISAYGCRCIW